jgi:hypothetical protein
MCDNPHWDIEQFYGWRNALDFGRLCARGDLQESPVQHEATITVDPFVQKQSDQIDANIAEVERLMLVQHERIVFGLCRGEDTSEDETKSAELRVTLTDMQLRKARARLATRLAH